MPEKKGKKRKSRNQNPTSNDLLNDKFSYLVNGVLESVRKDSKPLLYDKSEIYLGKHLIRKEGNAFVIYYKGEVVGQEPLYFLLESAMLVSYAIQHKSRTMLKQIESLDKDFSKYYSDCLNMYRVIKTLREKGDNNRANALVDKYNYAKERRDYNKKLIRSLCKRNVNKR